MCPKKFSQCAGLCHQVSKVPVRLDFTDEQKEWHKVFDLESLFDIISKSGHKPYMLVAGNTAHGNEFSFDDRIYIKYFEKRGLSTQRRPGAVY